MNSGLTLHKKKLIALTKGNCTTYQLTILKIRRNDRRNSCLPVKKVL